MSCVAVRIVLLTACLIGCSDASGIARPVIGSPVFTSLVLALPSSIHVGDTFHVVATPLSETGLPMSGGPHAKFVSSNSAKIAIDANGMATAFDTGDVTITATLDFGSVHSASASLRVIAGAKANDIFATNQLTFVPGTLSVRGDDHARATVTFHFGHVTHHVILHPEYNGAPRDLGEHADQIVTIPLRGYSEYDFECVIHPSMHGKILVQ